MSTNLGSSPLAKRSIASVTFTGAANLGQTGTATTFFTVTGEILCSLVPFCTDSLTESGGGDSTVALGVTSGTSDFVAATAADLIDTGTFWVDTGPDANSVPLPAALKDIVVTDNIIATFAGVDNTNGGTLRITLLWVPLSTDAAVT